jgi:ketosteroid isomerase-like protein
MGSDNKQVVRQMYEAYGRGDIDAVLAYLTDDFDWNAPGGAPFSGHRVGPQQMRQFFSEMQRWVQVDEFDADEFLADGDKVVVLGRQRATVRETGEHYETPWAHIYTLRNGKVAAGLALADTHAIASVFGESTRERRALTGPLGVTEPPFSGEDDRE